MVVFTCVMCLCGYIKHKCCDGKEFLLVSKCVGLNFQDQPFFGGGEVIFVIKLFELVWANDRGDFWA